MSDIGIIAAGFCRTFDFRISPSIVQINAIRDPDSCYLINISRVCDDSYLIRGAQKRHYMLNSHTEGRISPKDILSSNDIPET